MIGPAFELLGTYLGLRHVGREERRWQRARKIGGDGLPAATDRVKKLAHGLARERLHALQEWTGIGVAQHHGYSILQRLASSTLHLAADQARREGSRRCKLERSLPPRQAALDDHSAQAAVALHCQANLTARSAHAGGIVMNGAHDSDLPLGHLVPHAQHLRRPRCSRRQRRRAGEAAHNEAAPHHATDAQRSPIAHTRGGREIRGK